MGISFSISCMTEPRKPPVIKSEKVDIYEDAETSSKSDVPAMWMPLYDRM